MALKNLTGWEFIDDRGTFELLNPQENSYVYFPLVNPAGMMSSITPTLNGDAKLNQDTFLLLPVSVEDLHNTRSARHFWVQINEEPWLATGSQCAHIRRDGAVENSHTRLQAGFLWHAIHRRHDESGLTARVVNFVPIGADTVELMQVTLTNHGVEPLELVPTAAIPIFGRSADSLRDHRHVTALLHRTACHRYGVVVKPTMSFDERGHTINQVTYAILGADGDGTPPVGITPLVEDFIGEGGNYDCPHAIFNEAHQVHPAGSVFEGYESIGGLHFAPVWLEPGKSKTYILILAILPTEGDVQALVDRYGSEEKFLLHLRLNQAYWQENLSTLRFTHHNKRLDGWLQWVTLQPVLRRIMGNSFLPYHDYGRGGRGWRDLWQDLLTLILTDREGVEGLLLGNFAGVRMDGSNATIIGSKPGEFRADRNSIPRVWMDHGAWPLITTKLYVDLTGKLEFMLARQTYFNDHLVHRCRRTNSYWQPEQGTQLRSASGEVIKGTIFEHHLVQHLTAFFNVGEHNLIKMEGGDWNDAFDMASERGESVAFSALYADNLRILSELCLALVHSGTSEIELAEELLFLLDRVSDPLDYHLPSAKQRRLEAYFERVSGHLSGRKVSLPLTSIAEDLREKSVWLTQLIRQQEWLEDEEGRGWFNGYYDNDGQQVEGQFPQGVRMTLTGQVFPLMAGVASPAQAQAVVRAVDHYLYDQNLNGYRLNTHFGEDPPNLGRAFGFAYGHKENGAVFSHMAIMYAFALYRQGLVKEAWRVLEGLYAQSHHFSKSRIYPGIPEYFNPRGRGMYPYLTGSAAWYQFTLLTESFGVKGDLGDLCLVPKLVGEQFTNADQVSVMTVIAGKKIEVTYLNPHRLTYGQYSIGQIMVNDGERERRPGASSVRFSREEVLSWPGQVQIQVHLI